MTPVLPIPCILVNGEPLTNGDVLFDVGPECLDVCEFNPRRDLPARTGDAFHGFAVEWAIAGEHGRLHVCAACKARIESAPEFSNA